MKNVINFIKKRGTLILLGILILLITASLIIVSNFIPKMDGNVYGSRLDGIEDVKITDEIKKGITDAITATEKATSSTVTLQGKIIKVTIYVKDEIKLDDSKSIYNSFKDKLTSEILEYYDLEIIVINKEYSTFGYLKAGRKELKWTNNK